MANKPVKGLRVGNYRITPLGLAVLAAPMMEKLRRIKRKYGLL